SARRGQDGMGEGAGRRARRGSEARGEPDLRDRERVPRSAAARARGPVSDRERGRAGGDGVRGPARAGYGGRGGVGGSLPGGAAGGSDRGAPRPRGRGRGDGGAGGRAAG